MAFLSNLVASYLFDKSNIIINRTTYHGIYCYGGLVVFKGKKIVQKNKYWLVEYQQTVYKSAGNQNVQFTVDIWKNDVNLPSSANKDKVQILTYNKFPFLDTKTI